MALGSSIAVERGGVAMGLRESLHGGIADLGLVGVALDVVTTNGRAASALSRSKLPSVRIRPQPKMGELAHRVALADGAGGALLT